MKKHFIALIFVIIGLTLMLSGCLALEYDFSEDTTKEISVVSIYSKEESSKEESEISEPGFSEPEPVESSAHEEESSSPDEPEVTEINSLAELSDLLNSSKEKNELTVTFEYTGTENLDAQTIARMTNALYIYYSWLGNKYTVEITEFPGDRVVDAYFSGDTSDLSSDEKSLLNKALQIVNEAKAETDSDFELELYLHDYLTESITYYSPSTDVPDKNDPPRHLTAVGALLDGSANCQGYTDGFYTLASIAGFEVSRLSVVDNFGEGHMLNTVNLDGKWYIVDTTFDDVLYNTGDETNYRLFNAGKDMCDEYSWADIMEYYPIAEISDENYYYNNGDGKVFYDFETMADSIVNRWLGGETEFQSVMMETVASWSDLDKVLKAKLNLTGNAYSYTIWAKSNDVNTFYTVKFSQSIET